MSLWTKLRDTLFKKLFKWLGIDDIDFGIKADDEPEKQDYDEVDYSLLDWCYGGFKGSGAAMSNNALIRDLQVNSNGMHYEWASGGCEALGASEKTDYSHTLACFFCKVEGKWVGGKFDWISTSRLSRSFTNIREGYGGWGKNSIEVATEYAFVIVSKDGKLRSNVIKCVR